MALRVDDNRPAWLRKSNIGERKEPRPNQCVWVEDALRLRPCGKTLPDGVTGYCPKHRRMYEAMTGT